jgi:hypothetical protein
MHKEILNKEQLELIPFVKIFKREFYLVGGTAIALHIGHRRSIDFDLFKNSPLRHKNIIQKISVNKFPYTITRKVTEQLNVMINKVKFTFYEYPFSIPATFNFENTIRMPDLLHLAAMKAYALGKRSKWKDYVDLYFILNEYYSINEIAQKAKELYRDLFSEKLFRAQLAYFDDIDYTESIEYLVPPVSEEKIKSFLIDKATDIL